MEEPVMPYPVNEGPAETLTPENSVVLFIDHQLGLANWIRDQSPLEFKNAVLGLAGTAKTLGIPTILTTSRDFGPNGQILPELKALFPDVSIIRRTVTINAYRWPQFRVALEATGRRKVIIAGVSTTTCLQFPALDMVADGYDVYGVIDASGSESLIAREAAIATLSTRGVQIRTWFSVAAALVADWRRDEAAGWSLAAGPVREHEVAWGHLLDTSLNYAMGRMTPPAGFVEGDENATPQTEQQPAGVS
ncbi:MAG: isochorismatase family protein [Solirubrobacterales bacterium]|nr:isochorismatase family protein [Solirubrobacterales bacterium]